MVQINSFWSENHSSETPRRRKDDLGLRTRNDIHLARRLFHMMSGCLIVLISFFLPSKREMVFALVLTTLAAACIEYVRLTFPRMKETMNRWFRPLMREGEEGRRSGVVYYLAGCTVAAIVFPRSIAILAILYLAFGDPIASFFGVKYGKRFFNRHLLEARKSLEGSLACFVFCAFLTFVVSHFPEKTSEMDLINRLIFSILGGLGATLGEVFPLRTDDNLALPILSGAFLWLTAALLNLIPGLYFN